MRNNTPVSQREFPFPKGQSLVSTTDLKGRILHCNAAFIAVSGFDREELLGQPHNLIRHPDMPEEAFRDMWATIAAGQPWSGLVKNRRKDGDHYWVQANVTPLTEDGRPVAYMSVRSEPARRDVEAAEQLYALMRSEAATGQLRHRLQQGQVLRRGLAGRLSALRLGPLLAWSAGYALPLLFGLAYGLHGPRPGSAWFWPGLLGMLALCLLPGQRARSAMHRALAPLLGHANRLAAGDLSQTLKPSGRHDSQALETALNQLCVNLRAIVSDTRMELAAMTAITREIAQGNQDLSQRTGEQAASLEQTAAAMEQITGTVRSSTDTAHKAAGVAGELSVVSRRSAEVVQHVTSTMGDIAASSNRIGEIIQVIDSIAFQTNILALNAAVESARAGEHGRGFAVVASEVRALAQRSSTAAREIKQLIDDSGQKVSAGERQTESARRSIDETLQSVRGFTDLIGSIEHSADEQLSGISQVNLAIGQMDGITQQNSALVEQLARAAAQLLAQVGEVNAAVQVFRVDRRPLAQADAVALRKAVRTG